MFLKYLLESYQEKQTEIEFTQNELTPEIFIDEIKNGKKISDLDYQRTVMAKQLHKKGLVTIRDDGIVVPGKVKRQKTAKSIQSQDSLF